MCFGVALATLRPSLNVLGVTNGVSVIVDFLQYDAAVFAHKLDGVVAQLVERLVRNEKVAGSIPVGSTIQIVTCCRAIHSILKLPPGTNLPEGAESFTKQLRKLPLNFSGSRRCWTASSRCWPNCPVRSALASCKPAGEVYCPDVKERRRLTKAQHRRRKAGKLERDQADVEARTGDLRITCKNRSSTL